MYDAMIAWMCRVFHEQPYQAQMDFAIVALLAVVLAVLGPPVIFPVVVAHLRTLGSEQPEEESKA